MPRKRRSRPDPRRRRAWKMRAAALLAAMFLASCAAAPPATQGVVECDEETLTFEIAGTIASVPISEGQRVDAGALLSAVGPAALDLAVASAEADLRLAESRLAATRAPARTQELAAGRAEVEARRIAADVAAAEAARMADLHARGLASDHDRDRTRDALARASGEATAAAERQALLEAGPRHEDIAVAEAALAASRVALERVRERRQRGELRSPGPRVVRHIHLRIGEVANPGVAAITVADIDRPYVDAFVAQGDLAGLRVGGTAQVRVDGAPPVVGTIERIGERLEFTPRYLFGPSDRPALVARVRIRLSTSNLHAGVPADVVFAP